MSRFMRSSRRSWLYFAVSVLTIGVPIVARAQSTKPAVVRVLVVDTNRVPLGGADVIVIRDRSQAILIGQTDSTGRYAFRIDVDNDRKYSIAARRFGFAPAASDIRLVPGDTLSIDVELQRAPITSSTRQ